MQGEGTQGLGTPMYVRMYVEAPEASKTVSLSLSLSLSTPTVYVCTGLEGLGTPASSPLTTKD